MFNRGYENIRTQSIEVTITNPGITTIPNQAQLQGMVINSIQILSKKVCRNTPITNLSNIVDAEYIKRIVFNLKRRSDETFMYMPAAYLNPFQTNDADDVFVQNREVFMPQFIDFNQSQIQVNDVDNELNFPFICCLQIVYTDPQKISQQQTENTNNVVPNSMKRRR